MTALINTTSLSPLYLGIFNSETHPLMLWFPILIILLTIGILFLLIYIIEMLIHIVKAIKNNLKKQEKNNKTSSLFCQNCGKKSDEYELCKECFDKFQNGDICKCKNCNSYYHKETICPCMKKL